MGLGNWTLSGALDFYTAIPQLHKVQASARISLISLVVLSLFGCKTLEKDGEKEPEQPAQVMKIPVGMIHIVDPEGRFVLVRSSRTFQVESGTRLTSYAGDGTITGIFEVSTARKGAFLTADILQGTPRKGEQVLMDYASPEVQNPYDPVSGGAETEVQVLE